MRAARNKPLKNKVAQRQNAEVKLGNAPARKEKLRLFRLVNEQGRPLTKRGVIVEFDSKRTCIFIKKRLQDSIHRQGIFDASWRVVFGPDHRKYKGDD